MHRVSTKRIIKLIGLKSVVKMTTAFECRLKNSKL